MNLSRLGRGEFLAVFGGLLLALGVFLPWYGTNPDNRNANIDGARGTFSCWDVHPILHWLLLAAAAAPLILAWIIVRDHELSWPRGELTAIVGLIAFVLIIVNGLVDQPQDGLEIGLSFGWWLALLASIGVFVSGGFRAVERGCSARRKPPTKF